MTPTSKVDWYERRAELRSGMIFRTHDGRVQLDQRTEGDGTRWDVLTWYEGHPNIKGYEKGRWSCDDETIEPGDLIELVAEESLLNPPSPAAAPAADDDLSPDI